ncbi:MAG: class I SAM-dependent methyltransferase [Aquincola sp.]|nr:class I SAM-dependent methyltransferase [Aquincola sp.]MDH4287803.1 class I SAM-dependent methyltransferase [Aquincola sp.]MDH5330757.1 class I SAM-dependent methyltransferase [Aquincola sp.]
MNDPQRSDALIEWLATPPGRYLLEWEQAQLDRVVADVFGFHALQMGMIELEALRANRMPHRWVASERIDEIGRVAVMTQADALPFPERSLDLVVLPHTLELASDPHQALAEVERVLIPEGRVVILGFNAASLWGLRQRIGRARQKLGGKSPLFLPRPGEFIGYWRLRDWLRLLSFEVEGGRFGAYRPALASERWLDRFAWMDRVGDRWWPVLGSVYMLVAVKRVRGMRLVGLAKPERVKAPAAATVATNRQRRVKSANIE